MQNILKLSLCIFCLAITTYCSATKVSTRQAPIELPVDSDGDGLIEVQSIEQLYSIRYALDGSRHRKDASDPGSALGCPSQACTGYELTRDLDFSLGSSYEDPSNKEKWGKEQGGWEPIGAKKEGENERSGFSAIFDGNGFEIRNLYIHSQTPKNLGLFASLNKAEIRNLGLVDAEIHSPSSTLNQSYQNLQNAAENSAGILAGYAYAVQVHLVYVTGTVVALDNAGGMIGWIDRDPFKSSSRISNSYAEAKVQAKVGVGGLVGVAEDTVIQASYASGEISGLFKVGGLAGVAIGEVQHSYALGSVQGLSLVGSLIGVSEALVAQNYTAVTIKNHSGAVNIGGLIGWENLGTSYQGASYYLDEVGQNGVGNGSFMDGKCDPKDCKIASGQTNEERFNWLQGSFNEAEILQWSPRHWGKMGESGDFPCVIGLPLASTLHQKATHSDIPESNISNNTNIAQETQLENAIPEPSIETSRTLCKQ